MSARDSKWLWTSAYARDDIDFLRALRNGVLNGLDCTSTPSDDDYLLALNVNSVEFRRVADGSFVFLFPGQVWHLRMTACADGGDDPIESTIFIWIIVDHPPAILTLHRLHWSIEVGFVL